MSFRNVLMGEYWFSQPDPAVKEVYWIWVVGLLVITTIGFVSLFLRRYYRQNIFSLVFKKVADLFLTMGTIGLILFFFRQEAIPLFSWRMWFLVWAAVFLFFLGKIIWYYYKRIPEIKKFQEEKNRKEKYLP